MRHHFWDVAQARDAVIQADLEGVRAPLLRIADARYGDDLPVDWRDWVKEMQEQARLGAQVATLAEAAEVVAQLSNGCAECHRATRGGPKIADDAADYRPAGEGLPERMRRHMWAADALWVGITAKNHQAWTRGAKALEELPLPEPEAAPAEETSGSEAAANASAKSPAPAQPAADNTAQPPESSPATSAPDSAADKTQEAPELSPFAAKLDAIRILGKRADEAGQPAAKAEIYAQILTACADCHAHVRGKVTSAP